jgi:hypothetical protein
MHTAPLMPLAASEEGAAGGLKADDAAGGIKRA